MTHSLAFAIAQINPTVGSITANCDKILSMRTEAAAKGADLVIFGELTASGYPPEDLVLKPAFQHRIEQEVGRLVEATADGGPALLIGAPWPHKESLYNAVLLLDAGQIAAIRFKHQLPNYGVFDEKRVFQAGPLPGPIAFRGVRLGVMICEDMWMPDVAECLQESGADLFVVINGSPFETDKPDTRLNYAVARITENHLPLIYANLVGGQDELVFDGASFILGDDCQLLGKSPAWREHILMSHWQYDGNSWACSPTEIATPEKTIDGIYRAMVLGLRDYVNKNGFPGVLIGLSGGIDSALSAAVAVDALGADRVHCVMMPSPYTSNDSLEDAKQCANMLGVKLDNIPIKPAMDAFDEMLASTFEGKEADTTEENIQSRSRGLLLMALSNKLGHMLLTTGNKSEMSVGYATLYGDMCGGYSVLKDVYKTTVFELCRWRNMREEYSDDGFLGPHGRIMPDRIITKPPSAELKPDQTDQDSLPPYEILDAILEFLVEQELSIDAIVEKGYERATAERVWRMLDLVEYKRRQAPPGVKITSRAFGRDRRYPITNGFKG